MSCDTPGEIEVGGGQLVLDENNIKRGDTKAATGVLKDRHGVVKDITGSTLVFRMREKRDKTVVVTGAAVVVDGPTGSWSYSWGVGETDKVGSFETEVRETDTGGLIETHPGAGWVPLQIWENIS